MNHREFVKSRSYPQLRGEVHVDSSNNTICEGGVYVKDVFDDDSSRYKTFTGKPLKGDDFANPCGLAAKSVFNDTFSLFDSDLQRAIDINETDIANDYDKKHMFKRHSDYDNLQWFDVENGKSGSFNI
jgi:hypothetical protein